MPKTLILLTVLVSACATDPTGDADRMAGSTEPGVKPGDCQRAQELGYGDAAVESCMAAAPINGDGVIAEPSDNVFLAGCNTYSGACSGISGCSRAVGEGWQLTNCGSFIYSWMTICGGQPTGWGIGICLF